MSLLVEMEGISKRFNGTKALDAADFQVEAGEIHALVGENGAGKSTLMKILAGFVKADEGLIRFGGAQGCFSDPFQARRAGISTIYQDFDLAPNLTVAENLLLAGSIDGVPARERFVDVRTELVRARVMLAAVGSGVDPAVLAEKLSTSERQTIAIARALADEARLVIMDEPTTALSETDIEKLFAMIRTLRASGTAFVYISHKLDEVFSLADRITVFRDGRKVATHGGKEVRQSEIVRQMVGREISSFYPHVRKDVSVRQPLLQVCNLRLDGILDSISFSIGEGEIVGLYGLKGSGRSELAQTLFGIERIGGGTVIMDGKVMAKADPAAAMASGMAMVPEDRKELGLFPNLSVLENITVSRLEDFSTSFFLDKGKEREDFFRLIGELGIKTDGPDQPISELSGGNQQKVLLGRWLSRNPRVLFLDEPTVGVDIGAKSEIYRIIDAYVALGAGILLISSELPEILGMSDRILVLRRGRIVAEFDAASTSEEEIMAAIFKYDEKEEPTIQRMLE